MTRAQRTAVIAALRAGETQGQVARRLGVSKNAIAGIWWRRNGSPHPERDRGDPMTLDDRLAELHANLDLTLAETRDVPRLPNVINLVRTR